MSRNLLANIAGKFWSILSNFAFIPIYIQILGFKNYSVIALSLLVAGIMVMLDAGLSIANAREMARADIAEEDKFKAFRTLETIYFLIALACAAGGLLLAAPIATEFVSDSPIDKPLLVLCLKLIIAEAGLQMFFRFYVSTLMGLERQIAANSFNIGWGFLRNGLVIAVLVASPSLLTFFAWQLAVTVICLFIAKSRTQRILHPWRPDSAPRIDRSALRRVRAFTVGVFLISVVAVVNTQLDRLTIGYLLDLEYLGYYTLSVSIGAGMLVVSSPFLAAIQPRLTTWFSQGKDAEAADLYLRVTSYVAMLLFPLAAVIALNPEATMQAWIGDDLVVGQSAPVVPWIVAAYAMLSLSSMTYGVALANGFTRYNNIIGGITLLVSIPGYWLMVGEFGLAGAAILFLIIQSCGSFGFHFLIERRFLKKGVVRTFLQLWLVPSALSIGLAALVRAAIDVGAASRPVILVYLAGAYLVVFAGTVAVTSWMFRIRLRLGDLSRASNA